jgi:hypothetical protein
MIRKSDEKKLMSYLISFMSMINLFIFILIGIIILLSYYLFSVNYDLQKIIEENKFKVNIFCFFLNFYSEKKKKDFSSYSSNYELLAFAFQLTFVLIILRIVFSFKINHSFAVIITTLETVKLLKKHNKIK